MTDEKIPASDDDPQREAIAAFCRTWPWFAQMWRENAGDRHLPPEPFEAAVAAAVTAERARCVKMCRDRAEKAGAWVAMEGEDKWAKTRKDEAEACAEAIERVDEI